MEKCVESFVVLLQIHEKIKNLVEQVSTGFSLLRLLHRLRDLKSGKGHATSMREFSFNNIFDRGKK